MNKELEEAINNVKEIIEVFHEFPNPNSITIKDYEVEDFETVLKELERLQEDYIPKDKIREKIKEQKELMGKYLKTKEYGQVDIRLYKIAVLEELLEGK